MAAMLNATTASFNSGKLPWARPVVAELTLAEAIAEGLITAEEALTAPTMAGNAEFGIGHNQASDAPCTFQDDANAVVKLGTILTSFKRLGLAIRDPRCQRKHLRVLYAFMERLNRHKGTAFPDRKTIAEDEGFDVHTVENVLYDLRNWGHIYWERRAEPDLHKGRLLHYTLPVKRWSEERLREEITKAVLALREKSTPPVGYSKKVPRPQGTSSKSTPPAVGKSTPSAVCSNLLKEPEERKSIGADALAPADAGCRPIVSNSAGSGDSSAAPASSPQPQPSKSAINGDAGARPVDSSAAPSDFEQFWQAFPPGRKIDKGDVRDLFNQIASGRHKKRRAAAAEMIAAAERYAATRPDPQYTPAPKTWLNGGRWEDDVGKPKPQHKPLSRY